MSIASDIAEARSSILELLTDTVTLQRDEITTDDLGNDIKTRIDVWTGQGLVQDVPTNRTNTVVTAGETDHDTVTYVAKLPVDVDVRPGDWVRVDASLDPRHVGRSWGVVHVPTQAWALLHRCILDPDD